jgi:hypothetical protein
MIFDKPSQSLFLNVPDPFRVRATIPHSKVIHHPDYNIVLHLTVESARLLRNLGIEGPAPIRYDYRWPGMYKPMGHQVQMAEFQTLYRRAFNLSEPGTAKTAPALWATDWLMQTGRVKKTLIVAPLSTMETVWAKGIFKVLMHRKCVIVHRAVGAKNLNLNVDFYITNHDGVKVHEIREIVRKNPDINQIIVDEGDFFRNHDADKYDALCRMIREDVRIWWMTGTPCPQWPTDAWAQARIVNPSNVPKFFGAFKRMTMYKVSEFKWVPRPEAYEYAYRALQPAIRFTKDECLDLPPVVRSERQADLSKEQRKAFNEMRNNMRAEAKTTTIDAVSAADRILKLRQILCGSVKDPVTGNYIELPHQPRVEVLLDIIRHAKAKVYVVVPFTGIIHSLQKSVEKEFTCAVLNGQVTPKNRDRIVHAFQTQKDPHVVLCHPQVTSHGLDFTVADTLVIYAPINSNAQFMQVVERFNRPGQKNHMRIVRIGANALEWELYRMIDNHKDTQDNILSLFKKEVVNS